MFMPLQASEYLISAFIGVYVLPIGSKQEFLLRYILIFVVIFLIIGLTMAIYLPPFLEKQQKLRDGSSGCFEYTEMLQTSKESFQLNPSGSKWKRESMAAAGLLKKHGCTPLE